MNKNKATIIIDHKSCRFHCAVDFDGVDIIKVEDLFDDDCEPKFSDIDFKTQSRIESEVTDLAWWKFSD